MIGIYHPGPEYGTGSLFNQPRGENHHKGIDFTGPLGALAASFLGGTQERSADTFFADMPTSLNRGFKI